MDELLRLYLDPAEINEQTGYPWQWDHGVRSIGDLFKPGDDWSTYNETRRRIPDVVREQAGHRCIRCHHPFIVGETPGQWSPCDEACRHGMPARCLAHPFQSLGFGTTTGQLLVEAKRQGVDRLIEAEWRVLTVHHLNGVKVDCRWWNLVSLCQRCHLTIQAKVHMQRPYHREHSDWFKPYVAAFYAFEYLGEDLDRPTTIARLDELLDLEHRQMELG